MANSIKQTTLPNGLRVISDHIPSVESVAVGVWCDVGTRHEDMADNGVAHMVEHMMFKGTPTRTAEQIGKEVESVGGQMNAYTSREMTAYHIHLLKDDLPLALDILSDIVQRPTMPDEEVEKERHVILQEIGMSIDTPDDLVFDLYQETAYPGQALGAPILGTSDIIKGMQRDTLMGYVSRFYTPKRLVVSAAGNVDHEDLVTQVEKLFTDLPADNDNHTLAPADYKGGDRRQEKELEQAHILLGFEGVSRHDDASEAANLLGTVMGGGSSSRLFLEVREKRGLVYAVYSFHHTMQDCGHFMIYAGTGPDRLPELMPVLCDEVAKARNTITEEELAKAKAQSKAAILMARESMMNRARSQAAHLIHYGEVLDIEKRIAKIEALTVNDLHAVAERIFATKPTLAALGPLGQLEPYEETLKRAA